MSAAIPASSCPVQAFRAWRRGSKSVTSAYMPQLAGSSSSTRCTCPWTRAVSMTVTMPTMEELRVMGMAMRSSSRRMSAPRSGTSRRSTGSCMRWRRWWMAI